MFRNKFFPAKILDYINSHPAFDQHGGVIDSDIFYRTGFHDLIQCILNRRDRDAIKIIKALGYSQEDFKNTEYFFLAGWCSEFFNQYCIHHITMENAIAFLKIIEAFYQEYYGKPSEFQFPQETVTLQDEEDFIV